MERKIFWKFNIIDLLLISIILIGLIVLVYKVTLGRESDKTTNYLFSYTCQSAPSEAFNGVVTGLDCSDGDYGNSLGQLTAINISDIENDNQNKRATFVTLIKGKEMEHGVAIDETLYLKGKELNLIIGDSVFRVYLSNIQSLQ